MARRVVLLFVKYPEPGKVKTRLAATVGAIQAAEIYRQLVASVCAAVPLELELVICFDPPNRASEMRDWFRELRPGARCVAQAAGTLGMRLEHAFARAFLEGHEEVAVIGSDCVELDATIFTATWSALQQFDCAIGPAEDGGYYLLALRRPCPALFRDIQWSTESVFQQTVERASELKLEMHILPKLSDVDTEADWHRAQRRLRA